MTATETKNTQAAAKKSWFKVESLRLYSGLTLMVFLGFHLINHALGLISLDAMEAGRNVFLALWRSLPGTVLLLAAITVHIFLVFAKLLAHRSLRRIPKKEILQILGGLAIPPLMIGHVIGTRVAHEIFGITDNYAYVLLSVWIATPFQALLQSAGLIVAWLHGCLGLHYWLRLKPWYEDASIYLFSVALILPTLALCGFINGANEVEVLYRDAAWRQSFFDSLGMSPTDVAWAYQVRDTGLLVMLSCLGILACSRVFWFLHFRRTKLITISYPDGKSVQVPPGSSVLEASRQGGIPHASVCGGRGRCSTCRVRVTEGAGALLVPSNEELAVLKRVGAVTGTRLACQLHPLTDISIVPLLPAKATPRHSFSRPEYLQGQEKNIAILFADLRSFTKFSEHKLPYDVVFVINQYFRHMGEAVEKSGGHLDKFIGDGVMALFGLDDTSPEIAAKKALKAAQAMSIELEAMNENLKSDLSEPFRIGIGIHMGPVIVGEMGFGKALSITAIGDAVNTASRLETMNKEYKSQLIFSDKVAKAAGYNRATKKEDVMVRGRVDPLSVHIIDNARDLDL